MREDGDSRVEERGVEGETRDIETVDAGRVRERAINIVGEVEVSVFTVRGFRDVKEVFKRSKLSKERSGREGGVKRGGVRGGDNKIKVATKEGRESVTDSADAFEKFQLAARFVGASEEVAVEELKALMGVRDGDVASALNVAPTVSGEGDVNRVVISEDGGGVDDESASHIFGEVITRDLAVSEVGKRELLSLGEVCFLDADDVALRNKIGKGARDEIFATDPRDVGGVERETINIIGDETRDEGRGGGEGGEARGPVGEGGGRRGGLTLEKRGDVHPPRFTTGMWQRREGGGACRERQGRRRREGMGGEQRGGKRGREGEGEGRRGESNRRRGGRRGNKRRNKNRRRNERERERGREEREERKVK